MCGNGVITAPEQCDDGNTTSGDGCSSVCRTEPGASCTGQPSVCTRAVCGNGTLEAGEACDAGALNGLFYGDGSGCSRACTHEPSCRTGATTHACDVTCGNGFLEPGEACDDGNKAAGDGCSLTCTIEAGFACGVTMRDDSQTCDGGSGKCLHLAAILRDFKNESVSGGHPDFFYLGAPVSPVVNIAGVQGQAGSLAFGKRYCVPDAAGPAKRQDAVNRSWDLASATLGANGKPTFNTARANGTLSECQFIDWSHDGNGGHVPGYTLSNSPLQGLTFVDGASGHPMYRGLAPIVTSAASFGQWFVDSAYTGNVHTSKALELGSLGNGQYRLAGSSHVIYGGFFPLDPPGQFPAGGGTNGPGAIHMSARKRCSATYGRTGTARRRSARATAAGATRTLFPPSVDATLFPNGRWATEHPGVVSRFLVHDRSAHDVPYTGALNLQFAATDDLFVFINGILVADLGGTHQHLPARVNMSRHPRHRHRDRGRALDPTRGCRRYVQRRIRTPG